MSKHTHLAKRNIEEELLCNELRTQDSKSRVNRHNKELKENIEPKKFTSIKQEKPYRIKRTVTYMVEVRSEKSEKLQLGKYVLRI